MPAIFSFPDRVDERAARTVAAGVVSQAVLFLLVGSGWLLLPLAYGFAARVAAGPRLSPLGLFATRWVVPRLGGQERTVAGAPKRFAQGIGLVFATTAAVAWFLGGEALARWVIGGLLVAATLEAGFGVCLGCVVHNRIWGCADCADLSRRDTRPAVALRSR